MKRLRIRVCSLLHLAGIMTLLLATPSGAQNLLESEGKSAEVLEPGSSRLPTVGKVFVGEVLAESHSDHGLVLGIDRSTPLDDRADHIIYFTSAQPLDVSFRYRGIARVERGRDRLRLRSLDGTVDLELLLRGVSGPSQDEVTVRFTDGIELALSSLVEGLPMSEVTSRAIQRHRSVYTASLRSASGRIFQQDPSPGGDDGGCADECSITCKSGNSCEISCPAGWCATCECPTSCTCERMQP